MRRRKSADGTEQARGKRVGDKVARRTIGEEGEGSRGEGGGGFYLKNHLKYEVVFGIGFSSWLF